MPFNAKKFVKFVNQRQWDKVADFFHKEIKYTDPFCPGIVKGADKVLGIIRENTGIFPDYHYELIRPFAEEAHIALELSRNGKKIVWNQRDFTIDYSFP